MDPYPYSFSWGKSEEEVTKNNLIYIKETIEYEGYYYVNQDRIRNNK